MRVFHADPGNSIPLGKQGENNSLQVLFDTNTLFPGEEGGGTLTLYIKPPGTAPIYQRELTIEDGTAVWIITSQDTAIAGKGSCELTYATGGQFFKSPDFITNIAEALAPINN